jgi:hypothetical protein
MHPTPLKMRDKGWEKMKEELRGDFRVRMRNKKIMKITWSMKSYHS